MSNLYVLDVDESELAGDQDDPFALPSVFEGAADVFEWGVALWLLMDAPRGRRLQALYEPALQGEGRVRSIGAAELAQVVDALSGIEQAAERELTDQHWTLRPEAVERVRAEAGELAEEFDGAEGQTMWSIGNRLGEITRLRSFLALVLQKGGTVEFG